MLWAMVVVIARVSASAENRDALVAALEEMQEASRREDGCLKYGFYVAVEDPLSFLAVEEWRDRAALDIHFTQPHLQEFAGKVTGLVSGEPEIAIHEVGDTSPFPGVQQG